MELVAPLPFLQGKDLIVNNLASSLWHRHCFSATTWSFESGAAPSGEMCLVWSALALYSSLVSSHGRGGTRTNRSFVQNYRWHRGCWMAVVTDSWLLLSYFFGEWAGLDWINSFFPSNWLRVSGLIPFYSSWSTPGRVTRTPDPRLGI